MSRSVHARHGISARACPEDKAGDHPRATKTWKDQKVNEEKESQRKSFRKRQLHNALKKKKEENSFSIGATKDGVVVTPYSKRTS